jgi:hypothetical protein
LRIPISAAALGLCAFAPASATGPAETDSAAFARLRAAANEALKAHDYSAADARLGEALDHNPCHPGVLTVRAQVEVKRGRLDDAAATIARYAHYGFSLAPAVAAKLAPALTGQRLLRELAANAAPVGAPEAVFRTEALPILVEKVVFGPDGEMILGTVHEPGLWRVRNGKLEPFSEKGAVAGVFGLEADPVRGDLWVASSAAPQVTGPAHTGSALVRIDLRTGRRKAAYPLPRGGPQQWGDLTVGPDGTVYAGDGLTGDIWRLKPGASALELLIAPGTMVSPQGMAVTPDGHRLIVADYTTGMHEIDLATRADRRLPGPPGLCLVGTDSLAHDGDRLYAVQNGVFPERIVELTMSRDWRRVVRWRTLVANLQMLSEPTSGAVRGNDYYFVARSQWSDFSDDGALKTEHPEPAVIARIRDVK